MGSLPARDATHVADDQILLLVLHTVLTAITLGYLTLVQGMPDGLMGQFGQSRDACHIVEFVYNARIDGEGAAAFDPAGNAQCHQRPQVAGVVQSRMARVFNHLVVQFVHTTLDRFHQTATAHDDIEVHGAALALKFLKHLFLAIVKLVLRKNKVLANGLHPIMLRVCFGSQREKSTGYCCDIAHWDKKNEMVKPGFENAEVINKIISEFKMKIINRKLQFEMVGKKYTPEMLLDDSRQDFNARSNVFKEVMKDLLAGKQVRKGTKAHYLYAFKQLAEFMGTEDFLVNDLTENKMAAFIH